MNKLIYFLILFFFVSCKKSDKEIPTITLSQPADSTIWLAGDSLSVIGGLFDNEALSQFKIDLHNNFNGHEHEKADAMIWSKILVENTQGTQSNLSQKLAIPSNTAVGWYHFILTAVDEAGNQSDFVLRSIYIKNLADTIASSIVVNSPADGTNISAGSVLNLSANITDNNWVYIVNVNIRKSNSSTNLFESTDTTTSTISTFNLNDDIPLVGSAWTNGDYIITIQVYDSYFNSTVKTVNFSII